MTLLSGCGDEHGANEAALAESPSKLGTHGSARGLDVLLVTLDTVRADALGCYGTKDARTPVIDRLAEHGVRFSRTISPAPITLTSHTSIMTGLEPPSHGVRNNATFRLGSDKATLAELLSKHGYATGAVVGAFVLGQCYGLARGFQHYDDQIQEQVDQAEEGHFLERTADQVTDRAITWLRDRTAAPFFLWVHYYDAHFPYRAPPPFAPPARSPQAPWDAAANRASYLGEVAFVDSQLGRLLETLGPERLAHTLIVVTADHGEGLGEHGEFTHTILVYGATMRVPLLFSCPKLFAAPHAVDDRIAGLIDVAPTVLALLGIDDVGSFDGVSLFETRANHVRAIYGESLVPFLDHGWAPLRFLRRLDDSFIQAPRPEYYDLRTDENEVHNAYPASRPEAHELQQELAQRIAREDPAKLVAQRGLEPEEARRLAELGYVHVESAERRLGVIDPKDMISTWAVLSNALAASGQGNFDQALKLVDDVLRIDPTDAYAWETAYVVHWRRQNLPEAEKCLRKMLELNPTCEGYLRLATVVLRLGRIDECSQVLDRAAQLDPTHGQVDLVRGDMRIQQKRYEEARELYQNAAARDPVRCASAARRGLQWLDAHATD